MEFLLEIGTEEIPARMVDSARVEFARRVAELIVRERLGESRQVQAYSTPRRLAVVVNGVSESQPDLEEKITGPAVKVAYKDGQPTPAAHAFAAKAGVPVEKLQTTATPKGEYLTATVTKTGRAAREVLAESLPGEIAGIYWPKTMYWRGKNAERFIRPVRWVVAMLGAEVVPVEFGGIHAGSESRDHRVLGDGRIRISNAGSYKQAMEKASVVVSPEERRDRIRKALDAATRTIPGARCREDEALAGKVTNLTEYPSVLLGSFDREYLRLPEEVLVTVMRDHQNYFALEDANGRLLPNFLAVLNTDGDPEGLIRHGNERVLRARFNDARFFWQTDQKTPLRERVDLLKAVTFQKDLGSYYDKSIRTAAVADELAAVLHERGWKSDRSAVHEAARLAKTDLTAELVKEFTELQGVIGGLYARVQGLSSVVADAIYDQYKPASMDDAVPRTIEGAIVALADKADSIAGMFALGLQPTGSKDPFALRRQANGIVKIIAEHKLNVSLAKVFALALTQYQGSEAQKQFKSLEQYPASIAAFFRERLEFYLRDVLGLAYDVVNATLAAGSDDVVDTVARAKALSQVRDLPDFLVISAAFKRIRGILKEAQAKSLKIAPGYEFIPQSPEEEKNLASQAAQMLPRFNQQRLERDFAGALVYFSTLRPHIDAFFDKVMVMVDDQRVRENRLALLRDLLHDFSRIADFAEIVTERK